jgi:hypothetical protein
VGEQGAHDRLAAVIAYVATPSVPSTLALAIAKRAGILLVGRTVSGHPQVHRGEAQPLTPGRAAVRRPSVGGASAPGYYALAPDGNRSLAARSRVGAMTTFALESA